MNSSIDTLSTSLENAKLTKWQPVIDILLDRFQGIDINNHEDRPLETLLRLLRQINTEADHDPEEILIDGIAHAYFFHFRCRFRTDTQEHKWNPLEQSLSGFQKNNQVTFWEDIDGFPHPRQIRQWLMDQYAALYK